MLTSSALAVLAAAGWWWVTWPERTAREYFDLLRQGKLDDAQNMFSPRHDFPFKTESDHSVQSDLRKGQFYLSPRTWSQIIRGQQVFWYNNDDYSDVEAFEVDRGKVSELRY